MKKFAVVSLIVLASGLSAQGQNESPEETQSTHLGSGKAATADPCENIPFEKRRWKKEAGNGLNLDEFLGDCSMGVGPIFWDNYPPLNMFHEFESDKDAVFTSLAQLSPVFQADSWQGAMAELARLSREDAKKNLDFWKNLPNKLYEIAVQNFSQFHCLNSHEQSKFVCSLVGNIGISVFATKGIGPLVEELQTRGAASRLGRAFSVTEKDVVSSSLKKLAEVPEDTNFATLSNGVRAARLKDGTIVVFERGFYYHVSDQEALAVIESELHAVP